MKQFILSVAILFVFATQSFSQSRDSSIVKLSTLPQKQSDSLQMKEEEIIVRKAIFPMEEIKTNLMGKKNQLGMNYSLPRIGKDFIKSPYLKFVIPTTLISYGLITRGNQALLNLDYSTNIEIGEHISNPIPYDDYTQFAPAIAIYALDWTGIKAKHNFRDRTLITATSYMIMGATVQTMKTSFGVKRPDGSNNHSFPSGHTATAFVGAHILFKEYKDVSPWIGIGGYAIATATGAMRVYNKKHWVSDVVTGAGIGILSAELGYLLLPVWHKVLGIKDKDKSLVISPMVGAKSAGVGLAYIF